MGDGVQPPSLVLRMPAGMRLGGLIVLVILGAIAVLVLGLSGLLATGPDLLIAVFLAGIGGVMLCLFWYVLRDTLAKWTWRIDIRPEVVDLHLPRGRSAGHNVGAAHETVKRQDIEALDMRLEAYRSFGMVNLNRAYALKRRSGDWIPLGEDRALGTVMKTRFLSDAMGSLSQALELPVRDLGMVEGKGGVLGVLFTRSPPWNTPRLSAERQERLVRSAEGTGKLMILAVVLVLVAVVLGSLFAGG